MDPHFERVFGSAGVRRDWFKQVLQSALLTTILDAYSDFVVDRLLTTSAVANINSSIVLRTVKHHGGLPTAHLASMGAVALARDIYLDVLAAGQTFGNIDYGAGKKVQVEFVSVNPTGPLHVGHGRGAILGSALASVLAAAGYEVEKEYYVNDAGNQIRTFRRSLLARYPQALGQEAEIPADGYVGDYLKDIAAEIITSDGDRLSKLSEADLEQELGRIGLRRMLEWIKTDLAALEVSFDVWFSEQSLFTGGQYDTAMKLLRDGGYLAEREGATWFVSTALGEDKDNVIIRTDGTPTYFATDIAYHYNKFVERKFDRVIDIWGADHLGHVSRMKAVCQALGIEPDALTVIISQMVTLKRGGEVVKISKRSGDLITLRELVDEVGPDACRFNFLSRTADSLFWMGRYAERAGNIARGMQVALRMAGLAGSLGG